MYSLPSTSVSTAPLPCAKMIGDSCSSGWYSGWIRCSRSCWMSSDGEIGLKTIANLPDGVGMSGPPASVADHLGTRPALPAADNVTFFSSMRPVRDDGPILVAVRSMVGIALGGPPRPPYNPSMSDGLD